MHTEVAIYRGESSRTTDFETHKNGNRWSLQSVVILMFATAVACLNSGECTASADVAHPLNLPPLPPGTSVDMSLPFFKYWPNGRPALFEVRSELVLAVPPQYQPFWYPRVKLFRAPAPISAIPKAQRAGVAFQFFLPNFTGYTPRNYTKLLDPDRVNVIELQPADPNEVIPGAVGEYPPNMLRRLLDGLLNPGTAKRMYGLTCYKFSRQAPETYNKLSCWGRDEKAGGNYVMLDVMLPPYESWMRFPTMQVRYFSPIYGGVRLVWRTSAKNFSHWQEIDAHIWKLVKEWNISLKKTHDAKLR